MMDFGAGDQSTQMPMHPRDWAEPQPAVFGSVSAEVLAIGIRFTLRGAPGVGPSHQWLVTNVEQLAEMELRARARRRPESADLLAAVKWAVEQIAEGNLPGMDDLCGRS